MKNLLMIICSIALVSGCASTPQRRLEPVEHIMKTDGTTTMLYHSILYYPTELSLRFDGYIVGVEKSPRDKISTPAEVKVRAIPDAGLSKEMAEKKVLDPKLLYISHIVENKTDDHGLENCTIYNAYDQVETPNIKQLVQPCPESTATPITPESAYQSSWKALDLLERSMTERLASGKYSHIIVITMGWNTVQEEAVRNFNSIVANMERSAPPGFNPLVVGVTWPSEWESEWFAPLYRLVSFPVKANDADELGLTWLGVLLQQTIPQVKGSLPVVVIGHSFGSRAASVAACVGPAIYNDDAQAERSHMEYLINLQGAFLSNRLFGEKDRGFHYPIGCSNVDNIVFTSSVHDTAMNSAFWGYYAGDERSYNKHCEANASKIQCATADAEGNITYLPDHPLSNITYINASGLIKENAYLSGGGAHSDIYRKEHGALLNNILNGTSVK